MAMDERKQRVLRAIVSLYSVEGEPVGSRQCPARHCATRWRL